MVTVTVVAAATKTRIEATIMRGRLVLASLLPRFLAQPKVIAAHAMVIVRAYGAVHVVAPVSQMMVIVCPLVMVAAVVNVNV